ncbi:MAG: hypothetical protein JXA13_13170 [Anaerolineales bacterium]|nr:hypothetical protein [Anaerolineales bacterium]
MDLPEASFPEEQEPKERLAHPFQSLQELLDYVSGKSPVEEAAKEETGLAESLPFPFLAIVGQREMKLALLLGLINPNVGGILLIGPRGTAKTTAVRSLLDILPQVQCSNCYYGCLPEDIAEGGIDAVCPDCAKKFGEGQSLTSEDRVRLVELPLNAKLEDVVGGIDERAQTHERMRIRRGILARADQNLLYIDEVNLLPDHLIDVTLDAAAQGSYTVRRGLVSATYRSRFVLIGSMNPEEGRLRPQILDRFGLRVIVRGLENSKERLEAYKRVQLHLSNPRRMIAQYKDEMAVACDEIQSARERLPQVELPDQLARPAIELIQKTGIDSLRAEITWFEAARAHAAADGRTKIVLDDLKAVASMALRLRRSQFMTDYFTNQQNEENEINDLIKNMKSRAKKPPSGKAHKS